MRSLNRDGGGEAGFTLVELLVVILILGIVGGVTMTALVTGLQKTTDADQRLEAYSELQEVGARVTRELRAAMMTCPGTAVGDYATSVIVDRGGVRFRYAYSLPVGSEDVTLDQDRWDTATGAWVDVHSETVLGEVDNHTTGQVLFSFLDAEGSVTSEPRDVRTIQLHLRRRAPGDVVAFEQAVHVRNGGLPCPSL